MSWSLAGAAVFIKTLRCSQGFLEVFLPSIIILSHWGAKTPLTILFGMYGDCRPEWMWHLVVTCGLKYLLATSECCYPESRKGTLGCEGECSFTADSFAQWEICSMDDEQCQEWIWWRRGISSPTAGICSSGGVQNCFSRTDTALVNIFYFIFTFCY